MFLYNIKCTRKILCYDIIFYSYRYTHTVYKIDTVAFYRNIHIGIGVICLRQN